MDWGRTGASSLISMMLAAIVGPEGYGIVAIALVYVAFVELILDQGLGEALVQREDLRPEHLDSVFWLVLAMGSFLTGLTLLLGSWWARFNDLPGLEAIIYWLSPMVLIQGLTVVQVALLRRALDFRSLAIRSNGAILVGGAAGVVLAVQGFGVWALVVQRLVQVSVALLLLWTLSEWRPRLRFSWSRARDLMHFSTMTLAKTLAVFTSQRGDVFVMGIFFGPAAVGIYRMADRLTELALALSARPFRTVAFPHFSRLQSDLPQLRESVLRTARGGAAISVPALAVMAGSSERLVALIGPDWMAGADALQVLALAGILGVTTALSITLMAALGRSGAAAAFTWIVTLTQMAAFTLVGMTLADSTLALQAAGIGAVRLFLTCAVLVPLVGFVVVHLCGIRILDLLFSFAPSALSGLCGGGIAFGISSLLGADQGAVLAALLTVAPGALAATLLILLLDEDLRTSLQGWASLRLRSSWLAGRR